MSEFGFDIGSIMGDTGFTQAANWNPGALAAYEPNWFDKFGYWMNNPTNQNMLAKFGSALSPAGSWGDRLGQTVAGMAQSQTYGGNLNKAAGPILASMGTPQSGLGNPGTGAAGNASGLAGGATSPDPFVSSPSFTLSSEDMRGMTPDQIKDVMGTAVEAKKFPLEVARIQSGIESQKAYTEHLKVLNDKAIAEAADKKRKSENFATEMDAIVRGDLKSRYITPEDARVLKAFDIDKAATLADNLINLTKETGKKLTIQKVGDEILFLDTNVDAKPGERIVDRYKFEGGGEDKLPSGSYVNFAYSRAISNSLPALEEHYLKTLGDRAKVRTKMQQIQASLGKDPSIAVGEINSLLASAPQPIRDKIISDYNETLNSMVANKGQILTGGRQQGAGATPGMLENKAPTPTTPPAATPENKTLFDSLFKDSYSNVKVPTTGYFPKITEQAKAAGLRPGMAEAVAYEESGGDPNAKNPKSSATGIFQLVKGTARQEGVDAKDPDQNIKGGIAYLAKATKKAGGDPFKTALYYHDGINKDIGKASSEGIEYAKKVLSRLAKFGGLTPSEANRVLLKGTDNTGKKFTLFGDGRVE